MPDSPHSAGELFSRLVEIMTRLRAPHGCPWDREQTFDSIKPYTLEETYEVLDAVDSRDWDGLREELGDFILQAVFYAEIAREQGLFDIAGSLASINEKLVRRHPHVFGETRADTAEDVKRNWDEIKRAEKAARPAPAGREEPGILDSIPRSQPALTEAQQIGHKASKVGFDWPSVEPVYDKVNEELAEVRAAAPAAIEGEIGDLLFAAVNLARFYKVDAEQALRGANAKFRRRFAYVERNLGKPLESATLDEMESQWRQAKAAP